MKQIREISKRASGVPTSDGAGVRLFRVIGGPEVPELDPFLLLDEFLSDDPNDYIAGFPDHPHRGFETVTYMLAGNMRHRDNLGNSGLLEPGSVQWMTAGRGIVHSEMPEQKDGLMWGFQLWVNLPAKNKMRSPRYQDISPSVIPSVTPADGVTVRVLAGTFEDTAGPVTDVDADPLYLDVYLGAHSGLRLDVPQTHNAFIYVYSGQILCGARRDTLGHRQLGVLSSGSEIHLESEALAARAIVVCGKPFGEPIARYGPFVMNTRAELEQAFIDYRDGNL
ncbi:MAG: pirin family protein [Pseudomonadota bacterium]